MRLSIRIIDSYLIQIPKLILIDQSRKIIIQGLHCLNDCNFLQPFLFLQLLLYQMQIVVLQSWTNPQYCQDYNLE